MGRIKAITERFRFQFTRDAQGQRRILKSLSVWPYQLWQCYVYHTRGNSLRYENLEILDSLPATNVLMIANHQTYINDFPLIWNGCTKHWQGRKHLLLPPKYGRAYFVAATETMKENKMRYFRYGFKLFGGILVERSWRYKENYVKRELDFNGQELISKALEDGWVLNFPQGTTKPYAPCRKGNVHLLKKLQPIVLPVVVTNVDKVFNRKLPFKRGKQEGTEIVVTFKPPLHIDYDNDSAQSIMDKMLDAIEQSEAYQPL